MSQAVGITQVGVLSGDRVLIRFSDGMVAIHTAADLYANSIEELDLWQKFQEQTETKERVQVHASSQARSE